MWRETDLKKNRPSSGKTTDLVFESLQAIHGIQTFRVFLIKRFNHHILTGQELVLESTPFPKCDGYFPALWRSFDYFMRRFRHTYPSISPRYLPGVQQPLNSTAQGEAGQNGP